MNVGQIRSALLGVPDQQVEVREIFVAQVSNNVVTVLFVDGSVDSFDVNGKPVIET